MAEEEILETTCCFTGHRAGKLTRPEDEIRVDLEQAIVCSQGRQFIPHFRLCGFADDHRR